MRRSSLSKLWLALACGAVVLSGSWAMAGESPSRSRSEVISIQVQDAEIRQVLRLLADKSQLNFVVAEEVQGKLTMRLRNVRWQEALKVVLAAKSLGMEQEGNIVRIAPLSRLQEEAVMRANIKKADFWARPLKTHIMKVSYARAEDMAQQVKATLTERGTVMVDSRTNSLIIRDVE